MKHIPRIFIDKNLEFDKVLTLDAFDMNHILHVLRKNTGDVLGGNVKKDRNSNK